MIRSEAVQFVVRAARSQVGYRALPHRNSVFGQQVGYGGAPWDGSFLSVMFQDIDDRVAACPSTSALLQSFFQDNLLYASPRVGDIAFFAFSTDPAFGQPHVGLVTDTEKWRRERSFLCTEGMTASGRPKEEPTENGVFERVRYETDVIGFGRPSYTHKTASAVEPEVLEKLVPVTTSHFAQNRKHRSCELVQRALSQTVGLSEVTRGVLDSKTRSALAKFQRDHGLPGTGEPDERTLQKLARETGVFRFAF